MKGVNGCFVCGQDHRANKIHTKEEVNEAVKKLKEKHPQELLTVENLAIVVNIVTSTDVDEGDDKEDNRLAELDHDE